MTDIATVQPTPDVIPQGLTPNHFELRNEHISLSFSATSITGDPLMHFTDGRHDVNARGKEIRQEKTEPGTLVTITLEPDADAGELLFTLLLPHAILRPRGVSQPIVTLGVYTRSRLPPHLPVSAQLQTYEAVDLKGRASFIVS